MHKEQGDTLSKPLTESQRKDAFPVVYITHSETHTHLQPFDHLTVNETDGCSHKDITSFHILLATLVINELRLPWRGKLSVPVANEYF